MLAITHAWDQIVETAEIMLQTKQIIGAMKVDGIIPSHAQKV